MGDRALITVTDKYGRYTPSIYVHWSGGKAENFIKSAVPHMRRDDAYYAAFALAGKIWEAIGEVAGEYTSAGILPAPLDPTDREESHGDAGLYVVNVSTGTVECFNGYGKGFQIDPKTFAT